MSTRKDIMAPRKKKDGTTYWVKVGTAWLNDNGGTQLVFDALPIPDAEGRVVANLFEPRQPGEARHQSRAPEPVGLDDDVPF